LQTYDDCIIQLDQALAIDYGTPAYRLGFHAIAGAGVSAGLVDAFFHENIFALEDLPIYRAALVNESNLNVDSGSLDRPAQLFARESLRYPGFSQERATELLRWNLAAYFRYPKQDEPDPDPARLLANRNNILPAGLNYSKWVIDRFVKIFGQGAVELIEDKQQGNVVLNVFDRRAKDWHGQIGLRIGFIEPLIRNEANEILVEKWIANLQAQFSSRRQNLRIPPPKLRGGKA
jgi:hypothetical protein